MIILVPVSRFRASYEVAAGRPYSHLERLILRAVEQGSRNIAELHEIFHVHPRLLIEALVTLTHAGWLALDGSGAEGFMLTSEGRDAAGSDRAPTTTSVSLRKAFVVLERVTGGVISNEDVRFVSKADLKETWDLAIKLKSDVEDNRLDEGQVQHLLPRKQGEWVRWIGPIDMVTKDEHWLPVNVDLEQEAVVGLPETWLSRLRPSILDEAKRRYRSLLPEARSGQWRIALPRQSPADDVVGTDSNAARIPMAGWKAYLSRDHFYFSGDAHEDLFLDVVRRASTSVLVASAFASPIKLDSMRQHFIAALARGVNLDFLWGYMPDSLQTARDLVDWFKKLAYDAKRDGFAGTVRFNQSPSGSHAKLLIWDQEDGFHACVGSFNWLSAVGGPEERNVSVTCNAPGLLAALARCAAALWSGASSEFLTSTADRWRRIAADIDQSALNSAPIEANATLTLILDRNHDALLREWVRTSQLRLLIASHRLGPASETRLVSEPVKRKADFSFKALYGVCDLAGEKLTEVEGLVRRLDGHLTFEQGFHGKVLLSDCSACVSSYNFLSADAYGTAKGARELGVVIDGWEPTELLWEKLCCRTTPA